MIAEMLVIVLKYKFKDCKQRPLAISRLTSHTRCERFSLTNFFEPVEEQNVCGYYNTIERIDGHRQIGMRIGVMQSAAIVYLADETRFNLFHSDGRMLVCREPNQRYLEENMAPQEAFGGGGVIVWGGIIRN
ncbi:hypothetical protein NQ315_010458, partial [Exocentrus adspersus]